MDNNTIETYSGNDIQRAKAQLQLAHNIQITPACKRSLHAMLLLLLLSNMPRRWSRAE